MKTSELIELLRQSIADNGDLDVHVHLGLGGDGRTSEPTPFVSPGHEGHYLAWVPDGIYGRERVLGTRSPGQPVLPWTESPGKDVLWLAGVTELDVLENLSVFYTRDFEAGLILPLKDLEEGS